MPDKIQKIPIVAITMGDPCGVGPEVIVKAFGSSGFAPGCLPVVIGEKLALRRAVDLLGSGLAVRTISRIEEALSSAAPGAIPLLSTGELGPGDIGWGQPSAAACSRTVSWIETAVELALARKVDAVCTCPVNKARLHANGFPFPGHTEMLRDMTGAPDVVMMLAGPRLRVALATIHEPLARVPGLISRERLRGTLRITAEAMVRDFGVDSPRIAVAGLNPHAGEAGRFGREELDIISPAVRDVEKGPWRVSGPWPPDTLFYRALGGEFDAVVAMYHDQGLIPVKLVHFNEAVNVSLGLPIVRTSVDHGTAYDIAGTGTADAGSLVAAVGLASRIAENRRKRIDAPAR